MGCCFGRGGSKEKKKDEEEGKEGEEEEPLLGDAKQRKVSGKHSENEIKKESTEATKDQQEEKGHDSHHHHHHDETEKVIDTEKGSTKSLSASASASDKKSGLKASGTIAGGDASKSRSDLKDSKKAPALRESSHKQDVVTVEYDAPVLVQVETPVVYEAPVLVQVQTPVKFEVPVMVEVQAPQKVEYAVSVGDGAKEHPKPVAAVAPKVEQPVRYEAAKTTTPVSSPAVVQPIARLPSPPQTRTYSTSKIETSPKAPTAPLNVRSYAPATTRQPTAGPTADKTTHLRTQSAFVRPTQPTQPAGLAHSRTISVNSKTSNLLSWAQSKTAGYKDVNITNFTTSFKDGLAFCALIHADYPDKIDFDSLSKDNAAYNLKLAFDVGEKIGIPKLLDVEDITDLPIPEKLSMMTYIMGMAKVLH
ncbi:MICAL 2 [Pelomyxa schiedti]|nr:MICAL 2 [Pelomyxa schiedti]